MSPCFPCGYGRRRYELSFYSRSKERSDSVDGTSCRDSFLFSLWPQKEELLEGKGFGLDRRGICFSHSFCALVVA